MQIVTAPSQGVEQVARENSLNLPATSLPGLRPETKDVLKQFKSNLVLLEDLGSRLDHLLTDVRAVIRR